MLCRNINAFKGFAKKNMGRLLTFLQKITILERGGTGREEGRNECKSKNKCKSKMVQCAVCRRGRLKTRYR